MSSAIAKFQRFVSVKRPSRSSRADERHAVDQDVKGAAELLLADRLEHGVQILILS